MFRRLTAEAPTLFAPGAKRKSDFFRDIAGSQYLATGEAVAKEAGIRYDFLLNVFDRSIIEVENRVYGDSIKRHLLAALERTFVELPDTASRREPGRGADQGHPRHRRWRRPTSSAPATAARGCRSRRSTSAPRSCATGSART